MSHFIRFSLSVMFALFSIGSRADTITLRSDSWCPYICDSSPAPGYMIEAAKAIFEKAGHRVEYQTVSWKRAVELIRQNKITGIAGASRSDCPDCIFPDTPQGSPRYAFYTRKGSSWRYKGIDSLKTIRLGTVQGYTFSKSLDDYIARQDHEDRVQLVSGSNSLENNLKKLRAGHIDVLVEEMRVISYRRKQGHLPVDLRVAGALEDSGAARDLLYIAFSPQNSRSAEYARVLNQGWKHLEANGELQKILSRYGLSEWK